MSAHGTSIETCDIAQPRRRHARGASQARTSEPDAKEVRWRGLELLRRIGVIAIALQLMALVAISVFIYHRFTLGIDFGVYSQATSRIAHGTLDPYSTILHYPFIKSHFELIVWPIGLLVSIFRTSFVLLAVQDLSLAGTGLLVFLWVCSLVRSRDVPRRVAVAVLIGAIILILINPLAYYTTAIDFHTEATATFFAVWAAFDIWSGRNRRAIVWIVLCLLCGDVGGLYVAGAGLSAVLATPASRRMGWWTTGAGVAWVGVVSLLGANQGSFITTQYAYLAGRAVLPTGLAGLALVVKGIVTHPGRPWNTLSGRWLLIGGYLAPGGAIGVIAAWGFGVPAIVLLSSALQQTPVFIGEPYQQFAVFPFVLFGSAALVTLLLAATTPSHFPLGWWANHRVGRRLVAVVASVGLAVAALAYSHHRLPSTLKDNAVGGFIPGNEAASLRELLTQIPGNDQVIVSLPISGRFSARRNVFLYLSPTAPVPLREKQVFLVMDTAHTLEFVSPRQEALAARTVITKYGAHTVLHRNDLWVVSWSVANLHSNVVLP